MRNVALEWTSAATLPCGTAKAVFVAYDTASGDRYIATERILVTHHDDDDMPELVSGKTEVDVDIWKLVQGETSMDVPLATLTALASGEATEVVSLKLLSEKAVVCVILASGTIATIALGDPPTAEFDVVGDVESGISAAAWSPDEGLLVIMTGNDDLLQMTSSFDVLSERPVHTTSPGEDQPITVGWGSTSTQFHGSAGKAAAAAAKAQAEAAARGAWSPDDDSMPRISWRGDGAFFVVSTVTHPANPQTERERRLLHLYNREAKLQTTSEPVPGLEHPLAWRPSGALIASTQRFGFPGGGAGSPDRHDVVFFERNGLRHGEFQLRVAASPLATTGNMRWGYRVKELLWSSDSAVLAVWIKWRDHDEVQLWTINNYHWYLKQVITPPPMPDTPKFISVAWHPEQAMRLVLTTASRVMEYSYAWTTARSSEPSPNDTGTVAVIDGSSLLMTPFRKQNVPPPMSSYQISLGLASDRPPIDAAFDSQRNLLAVLCSGTSVEIWALNTNLDGPGSVAEPKKILALSFRAINARQVLLSLDDADDQGSVAVLGYDWQSGHDVVHVLDLQRRKEQLVVLASNGNGRLVSISPDGSLSYQGQDGSFFIYDSKSSTEDYESVFPQFCFQTSSIRFPSPMYVGLSAKAALYFSSAGEVITLATNCTSYVMYPSFLIYTTSSHEARFVPLHVLESLAVDVGSSVPEWEHRRMERGSRIVTVVPSTASLVLQMPRGNLETVNPRPLVLEGVRSDIDNGNYRGAFLACRKHRIDLNALVDHNPDGFMSNVESFVRQVDDVDHINLFLTGIGQSSQSPEKIAGICDAIRTDLEQRDLKRYVNSILTAHVVKKPADVEAGLRLLLWLRDEDPETVEDAIKYIIFLVDVDLLFDTALGMYDFSLVLMIAQHSQKDPREYLPFLRELRALEQNYQRYRIDDHLKRYSSALRNLRLAGPQHFDPAKQYIKQHGLYTEALRLWIDDAASHAELLDIYGDFLFEKREYRDAAISYVMSHKTEKALLAYEKDSAWRELFTLATTEGASKEKLSDIASRMGDRLSSRRRYGEAAQVYLDYAGNVEEAIITLISGSDFSEALRIVYLHERGDLVQSYIHPGALNAAVNLSEDIEEMTEQLQKQSNRWDELQVMKATEPDAYYLQDNPGLHNVDVMTEASGAGTAFTRFTVAPSIISGVSTSKSSKGRRKNERKRLSGKKGTVNEEEYLLSSVIKLVTRLHGVQGDVAKLLPHLVVFSDEHREEARNLQDALLVFESKLQMAVNSFWTVTERVGDASGAGFMKEPPIPKPQKPTIEGVAWKINFLDGLG